MQSLNANSKADTESPIDTHTDTHASPRFYSHAPARSALVRVRALADRASKPVPFHPRHALDAKHHFAANFRHVST